MSKKITAVFFISLLAFNSAGILCYYYTQLQTCKTQARAYIQSNKKWTSLSVTKFSARHNNFDLNGKDEIECNGNMYDIITVKFENADTLYYAVSDEKEDALIQGITAFAKSTAPQNNETGKNNGYELVKYTCTFSKVESAFLFQQDAPVYNNEIISFYFSPVLSTIYLPPKLTA